MCVYTVIHCIFCILSLFAVLHENKDDVTALHCKIVCLIQNGGFKEALNVMNTHTRSLPRWDGHPDSCWPIYSIL